MGTIGPAELVEELLGLEAAGAAHLVDQPVPARRQGDQGGPAVGRVGSALDEPFGLEGVDDLGGGARGDVERSLPTRGYAALAA
jgi:hypothetical protein